MRELNRFGITSVIDAGGGLQNYPEAYDIIETLHQQGELTMLVPWALRPLFQVAPALGLPVVSNFVISAIIVGLATYVIMPRYTRLMAGCSTGRERR
jgi:hypothetical protein